MKTESVLKAVLATTLGVVLTTVILLLPAPASADAPICSTPELAIPPANPPNDTDPGDVISDTISTSNPGTLIDLNLSISTTHAYVGDLIFTLTHKVGPIVTSTTIFRRPLGVRPPPAEPACSGDNINIILDDEAALSVQDDCQETLLEPDNGTQAYITGESYRPLNPLSIFDGNSLTGTWELAVNDNFAGDNGTLHQWCLIPTTPSVPPTGLRTYLPIVIKNN